MLAGTMTVVARWQLSLLSSHLDAIGDTIYGFLMGALAEASPTG
jgi:hypothetical protein